MLCQNYMDNHKIYDSIEQLIGRYLLSSNGGNLEVKHILWRDDILKHDRFWSVIVCTFGIFSWYSFEIFQRFTVDKNALSHECYNSCSSPFCLATFPFVVCCKWKKLQHLLVDWTRKTVLTFKRPLYSSSMRLWPLHGKTILQRGTLKGLVNEELLMTNSSAFSIFTDERRRQQYVAAKKIS